MLLPSIQFSQGMTMQDLRLHHDVCTISQCDPRLRASDARHGPSVLRKATMAWVPRGRTPQPRSLTARVPTDEALCLCQRSCEDAAPTGSPAAASPSVWHLGEWTGWRPVARPHATSGPLGVHACRRAGVCMPSRPTIQVSAQPWIRAAELRSVGVPVPRGLILVVELPGSLPFGVKVCLGGAWKGMGLSLVHSHG